MTDRTWYSVLVEFRERPDEGAPITDDAIDSFMDLLVPHSGSVSGGAGYSDYGARVSVEETSALFACGTALRLVHDAATHARLPAGHVIRLQATRQDVLDDELARSDWPDLVSAPEAGEILGVTAQRVHTLAASNSSFPKPVYRLRTGKIWLRAAIEKFAASWDHKPGWPKGRPRKPVDDATVRRRAVKGWVFMDLPDDEQAAIKAFLDGGDPADLPDRWRRLYEGEQRRAGSDMTAHAVEQYGEALDMLRASGD